MVVISPPPPTLGEALSLFYVKDNLLANAPILVFYGSSNATTTGPTSSRIQAHVFATGGFQSYPRLALSPSSPLYAAVNCLSREDQGDEVCRGLAFSVYKYFSELPDLVKNAWRKHSLTANRSLFVSKIFGDDHAASLASRMVKVENIAEVIADIQYSLAEQSVSWLDVDIVLPPGSMQESEGQNRDSGLHEEITEELIFSRYGPYAPLIKLFGEPAFLPTTKLRRAPSRGIMIGRNLSFSKLQKEKLRREFCEFVDTEERYVSKIHDLVHSVAEDFREKARTKAGSSSSPTEDALAGLFPPSLDEILRVNSGFLEAVRSVLEETENDAIKDIEAGDESTSTAELAENITDMTGTLSFAQCLLTWFPQFAACYGDYISAHADFAQFLKIYMNETASSFSKRIQDTGEQRLMSMLIEPVQRLPRYTLYIDNITKQLPMRHPALKVLLKARDIIADICSPDTTLSEHSKTVERLREIISSWPPTFIPQGRFLTAVDVVELAPPYRPDPTAAASSPSLLLLFADHLVLIRRPPNGTMTARGLLAELAQQSSVGAGLGTGCCKLDDAPLLFHDHARLSDIMLSELHGGMTIQIMPSNTDLVDDDEPHQTLFGAGGVRTFSLAGAYEGKAGKLAEEVVKGRVEARFSENERESAHWEAWRAQNAAGGVGLFAAIFEEAEGQVTDDRGPPAQIRIVVDQQKGANKIRAGTGGVMIAASLTVVGEGFYKLEIEGLNDHGTRDHLTATEFLPVLTKRLSNLLQMRNQIRNPARTTHLLRRNYSILHSLTIIVETQHGEAVRPKTPVQDSRPLSPVKMLSNIFGTGSSKGPPSPRKIHAQMQGLGDIPRMPPPSQQSAAVRQHADAVALGFLSKSVGPASAPQKATILDSTSQGSGIDSLQRLEQTLASYTLALHARKGNVVGRVLMNRAAANELAVNELYNTLLEDPTNYQIVAETSVDVLFAAFEKFLRVAWEDRMGPVVNTATLAAIQSKSESLFSGAFEVYFKTTLSEMTPQNQRAFRSILKLLADLLDGTGNDGDKGILTAAFAELLVAEDNAHDFMSLMDRFVEDLDILFTDSRPTSSFDQFAASEPAAAANTGSVSSNTSSLRKRFGFGTIGRENSKHESESKLASVLRTLGKPNKNAENSQPPSLSKAVLGRSQSTDVDPRPLKRPSSRDRPAVLGAFAFEERPTTPGRSPGDAFKLSTIGESQSSGPPRKKRRSSLSDLKTLQTSTVKPSWSPVSTPRKVTDGQQRGIPKPSPSPRTPSPTKVTNITTTTYTAAFGYSPSSRLRSPNQVGGSPIPISRKENSRIPSVTRKDSSPVSTRNANTLKERPTNYPNENASNKTSSPSKQRNGSVTRISPFKSPPPLSERPTSGNVLKPHSAPSEKAQAMSPSSTAPRRLRMQSPQKLRERLQNEQNAIATTEASLQAELSRIGEEMSGANCRSDPSITASPDTTLKELQNRLNSVETSIPALVKPLQESLAALSRDINSSLTVSENKAKKLDELYREANAENEALYARFNDELAKIAARVRAGNAGKTQKVVGAGGGNGENDGEGERKGQGQGLAKVENVGVEELKRLLRESREEVARGKREVGRLRRENLGLRAQLKEG